MPGSPDDSFQNVVWQDAGTGADLNFDEYPSPRTMFSSLPQYESHEQQAVSQGGDDAAIKREPPASTLVQTAEAQHHAGDVIWKDVDWGSPVAPANPMAGPSQLFNHVSSNYQSGMFSGAGQDGFPSTLGNQAFAASLGLDSQALGYNFQPPQQDAFDDFSSSVYPPLDAPANPMPYHHLPNSTQQYVNPVANAYNVTMVDSFDSNNVSVINTGSNATGYQETSSNITLDSSSQLVTSMLHSLPNIERYGHQVKNSYNIGIHNSEFNTVNTINTNTVNTGRRLRSNAAAAYQGTSNPILTTGKVKLNRAAKRRGDPSCDPSTCYSSNTDVPLPWGSVTWYGQFLFTYTHKGQWLLDRCFETQQLREFSDNCHKESVFWVQQTPTQCNHRLDPEDRVCRWAGCPVPNRSITAGWLRVAFDESPSLTTNGAKDPLKYSGSVHLWCFEQMFDPVELHASGRLRPDDRTFPSEDKSVVTLEKLTDAGIIRDAYLPWFNERMGHYETHGPAKVPRPYEESLSYRLTKYHLDNQSAARQKARSRRNEHKADDERRTIDVHRGDLRLFVNVTKKAKRAKKRKRLKEVGIDGGHGHLSRAGSVEHGQPRLSIGSRRPQSRDVSYGTNPVRPQARAQFFNPLGPLGPPAPDSHNLHPKTSNLKPPLSPERGGRVQNQPHMPPGPRWNQVVGSLQQGLSSRASGKQPVYYHRSRPGQVQRRGHGQQTLAPSALPRQPPYFSINSTLGLAQSQARSQGDVYRSPSFRAVNRPLQFYNPPPRTQAPPVSRMQNQSGSSGFKSSGSVSVQRRVLSQAQTRQNSSFDAPNALEPDLFQTSFQPLPQTGQTNAQSSNDPNTDQVTHESGTNRLSIGPNTGQIKYESLWGERGQSYIDDLDFDNIYDATNDADLQGEDAMHFVLGATESDDTTSDAGQRQAEQTRSSPGTKRRSSHDDDEEEKDENNGRRKDIGGGFGATDEKLQLRRYGGDAIIGTPGGGGI